MRKIIILLLGISLGLTSVASAADQPRVGRRAAAKYFGKDVEPSREVAAEESSYSGDRLLMLHIGGYSNSSSYQWKDSNRRNGVGKATYGVTYLFDKWAGLDVNVRFDFNEYKIDEERATKLSAMPLWTFPAAETKFPLYFGGGVGAGVYFTQLADESNISLDYQLVVGTRFLDLIENAGFFAEYGLKNHLHLLSDGQFNGAAVSVGAVFSF